MRMLVQYRYSNMAQPNHGNRFSAEQRLFIFCRREMGVEVAQVMTQYVAKFGPPAPNRKAIYRIHKKIATHHTPLDLKRSGRPSRPDDDVLEVMGSILDNPTLSVRKRALSLDMADTTVRKILKIDLKFKAYKITRRHRLRQPDFQKRIDYSIAHLSILSGNPTIADLIWYSDEAHVQLDGYVNSQNARHWGSTRPDVVVQRQAHPPKLTIWVAISSYGIIGPFFFEENGATVTVNGQRYLDVLQNSFIPALQQLNVIDPSLPTDWWFMQDGARPHITRAVKQCLQNQFNNRTIGEGLGLHYPARSPDLNPLDFGYWGWLKDELFRRSPSRMSLQILKRDVIDIVQNTGLTMCRNICRSVEKRLHLVQRVNGRHFEHMM